MPYTPSVVGLLQEASFTAMVTGATVSNNKSMLALFNGSQGNTIKLRKIFVRNAATSPVTGVVASLELRPMREPGAGLSGGTDIVPLAHDTHDIPTAGLLCKTGATVTGESTALFELLRMSTDEWGPGTSDVESDQQAQATWLPLGSSDSTIIRPWTCRPGQGVHLKFATNSTAGLLDVLFIFTRV